MSVQASFYRRKVLDFHFRDVEQLPSHAIFKYPAKFHPPVARSLIEQFSSMGDTVYDPFCGSGTLLVEASAMHRAAVGSDVDPVALFVSRVKTTRCDSTVLESVRATVVKLIREALPDRSFYTAMVRDDFSSEELDAELQAREAVAPPIPNIDHWFRRYVVRDLSVIRQIIYSIPPSNERDVVFLGFLAGIRSVSNADPVPVSGLEVTRHMRNRDELGRIVDTPTISLRYIERAVRAATVSGEFLHAPVSVVRADATDMSDEMRPYGIDTLITSPPYANAVDYYRRHSLEMYWGGMVDDAVGRKSLIPSYIGKHRVAKNHPHLGMFYELPPTLSTIYEKMLQSDVARARDLQAYVGSMGRFLGQAAELLPSRAKMVLVVGDSTWRGNMVSTAESLVELAINDFELIQVYSYPLKNRYMSYARKNNADISKEFVIEMRRR